MKKIVFLIILFTITASAQVTQEWVVRYKGPTGSWASYPIAIGVDNNGNIYVAGNTLVQGYWDFATVKYNSDGVEQWVQIYDGPGNERDMARAMVIDEDGNVYVTGTSVGSASSNEDITTIKYSPQGQQLWENRYSRTGMNDAPSAIALDSDGNVYVTGYSRSVSNGFDYVTIKYNSLGAQQWVRFYNGPANGSDGATALFIDSEDNIYVTGNSTGIGTGLDIATIKYNSAGAEQWIQRYNGSANSSDFAWAITIDNNSNIYVTGGSFVTANNTDLITIKYNSNGIQQWVRNYDGPGEGESIAADQNGNIYVGGKSELSLATVKYDSTGELQWVQRYSNPDGDTRFSKMVIDNQANVYVTGGRSFSGLSNFLTIKYDTDGNQQWLQTYWGPDNSYEESMAIAIDDQKNIYITGYSDSNFVTNYATIKYSQEDEKQPPTNLAYNENNHSLTWAKSPSSGVQNYLIMKQSYDSGTNTFSEWISVEDSGGVVPASDEEWVIRTSGFYNYKVGAVFSNDTLFTDSVRVLRGYVLRRKEGDVVTAYNHHVNSFKLIENDSSYIWPYSWYQQFSYLTKPSSVFHDWPLHKEIVGSGNPKQYLLWYIMASQWEGSCYGFAAYSLLNFNKNASFYQQFPLAENIIPGEATITDPLRKIINHLMSTQIFDIPTRLTREPSSPLPDTAIFILSKLINEFSNYEANNFDRTLSLFGVKNLSNKTIKHAILPVAIEKVAFQSPTYTVWVYDSNSPDILMNLTISTDTKTWNYPQAGVINQTGGIFLQGSVSSRLGTLNFDFNKENFDNFKLGGENYTDSVEIRRNILVSPNSSVLVNIDGETIAGYDRINNDLISYENSIVAASDGYLRAPFGYELPMEESRVIFSDQIEGSSAGIMFQAESENYYFAERTDGAGNGETEIIDINQEGLSYLNNDNTNKTISLVSFYTENDLTKLANVNTLEINQNEVIDLSFVADQVILKNTGTAKTYSLTLSTADNDSESESNFELIPLTANTTHFIQPDWNNIDSSALTILIDLSNDGTIDDTLVVPNPINSGLTFQVSVNVEDGWNMVSVPGLHPVDQNVNTWWMDRNPSAQVFRFDGGYQSVTNTSPGEGYWMKHIGSRVYNTGDEWPASGITVAPNNPISANAGWNLIGGYHLSIPISSITTTPPGLQQGLVYGYSSTSGYSITDNLVPGYAYWINLSAPGQINIPASVNKNTIGMSNYINEEWGRIIITDNAGKKYTLYGVTGGVNLNNYLLPPQPPAELFDVRYSSGRYAEDLYSSAQLVEMTGVEYPVTIRVENLSIRIEDESGKKLNSVLKSGEEIVINEPSLSRIKVMAEGEVITQYSLSQNYPNPFNPSTKITFVIPNGERNLVTLKVYDILGNEVATLVNEYREAGRYEVTFDASNLASGMYLYRLQAGSYIETKKMILIK